VAPGGTTSAPGGDKKISAQCIFYAKGSCCKGDDCRFSHEQTKCWGRVSSIGEYGREGTITPLGTVEGETITPLSDKGSSIQFKYLTVTLQERNLVEYTIHPDNGAAVNVVKLGEKEEQIVMDRVNCQMALQENRKLCCMYMPFPLPSFTCIHISHFIIFFINTLQEVVQPMQRSQQRVHPYPLWMCQMYLPQDLPLQRQSTQHLCLY